MSSRYLSEIIMFAGTFAPMHWSFCDGQQLAVSTNQALYSLLGTTFGGDGRVSFALPEMRGRAPVGQGSGPGLTHRALGQKFGTQFETLTESQIPSHTHSFRASSEPANLGDPSFAVLGAAEQFAPETESGSIVPMSAAAVSSVGQSDRHLNVAPSLAVNFVICMAGVYPPRS